MLIITIPKFPLYNALDTKLAGGFKQFFSSLFRKDSNIFDIFWFCWKDQKWNPWWFHQWNPTLSVRYFGSTHTCPEVGLPRHVWRRLLVRPVLTLNIFTNIYKECYKTVQWLYIVCRFRYLEVVVNRIDTCNSATAILHLNLSNGNILRRSRGSLFHHFGAMTIPDSYRFIKIWQVQSARQLIAQGCKHCPNNEEPNDNICLETLLDGRVSEIETKTITEKGNLFCKFDRLNLVKFRVWSRQKKLMQMNGVGIFQRRLFSFAGCVAWGRTIGEAGECKGCLGEGLRIGAGGVVNGGAGHRQRLASPGSCGQNAAETMTDCWGNRNWWKWLYKWSHNL